MPRDCLAQAQYPKIRLEEEGAKVDVAGGHPAGMKYTGKFGEVLLIFFLLQTCRCRLSDSVDSDDC